MAASAEVTTLTVLVIPLTVQWWSVWYPGSEPGGGSYIAQRMLAAKTERDAMAGTLFFNAADYLGAEGLYRGGRYVMHQTLTGAVFESDRMDFPPGSLIGGARADNYRSLFFQARGIFSGWNSP